MKKSFIDNPFFKFMGQIGDIILLNVLFVITSIPIVTAGASITALYRVTLRMARGESNYPAKEYFQAWKADWKQSSKMWLFFLPTGILFAFDFLYLGELVGNVPTLYFIAIGCVFAVWYMLFLYVFWLEARFENAIRDTMKNALLLSVKYLPYTIIMAALNAVPVFCIIQGINMLAVALPVYFFFGFSLTARINGIFVDRIFGKMIAKAEETEETALDEPDEVELDEDEMGIYDAVYQKL